MLATPSKGRTVNRIQRTALLASLLVAGAAASTDAAARGNVYWSIGIQAPIYPSGYVGTVVSNAPVMQSAPVWVVEPPAYYAPPPQVVYLPQPVYVPQRVVYRPVPYPVYSPRGYPKVKYRPVMHRWHGHDD